LAKQLLTFDAFKASGSHVGFAFGDLNFRYHSTFNKNTGHYISNPISNTFNNVKIANTSFTSENATCPLLDTNKYNIAKRAMGNCDRIVQWTNDGGRIHYTNTYVDSIKDSSITGRGVSDHLPVIAILEFDINNFQITNTHQGSLQTERSENIDQSDIETVVKAVQKEEAQQGGSQKIRILGRLRKIHVKNNKSYVMYNKKLITLSQAKKLK
jgi:hypothetical protein